MLPQVRLAVLPLAVVSVEAVIVVIVLEVRREHRNAAVRSSEVPAGRRGAWHRPAAEQGGSRPSVCAVQCGARRR